MADTDTIWVSSIVSTRTGKGMVQLMWGEKAAQLSVKEARDHAIGILEACEAARSDELIFKFLTDRVKATPETAAMAVSDFRELREKAEQEAEG